MLTRFGFRGKMYYLCTSEEERALNTGISPLFLAQYKGCNTKHLGFSRCFSGERIADVGFFIAAEIIKDIKVFRAKKVGF